ncbi:MAG: hypothetical protein JW969_01050 [Spirochaetales bacterium]|nr:hypothetical protein [Spirochaetales bacterium]
MKLTVFILILCVSIPVFALSGKAEALLDRLDNDFPSIKFQVFSLENQADFDLERGVNGLEKYLEGSNNPDVREAVKMAVLSGTFWVYTENFPGISIDGKDDDWRKISSREADLSGDGWDKTPSTDLTEAGAFIDRKGFCYLLLKTAGKIRKDQWFDVSIFGGEDATIHYELCFKIEKTGDISCWVNDRHGGNGFRLECTAATCVVFESRFRLDDFPELKTGQGIKLLFYPRLMDLGVRKIEKGKSVVLKRSMENHALRLLLYLLSENDYILNDSMTACIALADSYLYGIGTAEVKKAVLTDAEGMWLYYREVLERQGRNGFLYGIGELPLLAKLFWADRTGSQSEIFYLPKTEDSRLSRALYDQYVITPDLLEHAFSLVKANGLFDGRSLEATASLVEEWVWDNFRYHYGGLGDPDKLSAGEKALISKGDDKVLVGGETRRYFEMQAAPYQFRLYDTYGFFSGNCGMHTVVSRTLYQALGISSCRFWYTTVKSAGGKEETVVSKCHTFPAYFNPLFRKWYTHQNPHEVNERGEKTVFHIWKEARHGSCVEGSRSYQDFLYGENFSFKQINILLSKGIGYPVFSDVYGSDVSDKSFLAAAIRTLPKDSDNDRLLDEDEVFFGTNPESVDSDNDGYSDRWEIESGFDPLSSSSPPGETMFALDGFALEIRKKKAFTSVPDPEGDSKVKQNVFDISSVNAIIKDGMLYAGVTYHSPVFGLKSSQHELWISTKGREPVKAWVRGFPSKGTCDLMVLKNGKWTFEDTDNDIEFKLYADAEFQIPLKYLGNPESLTLSYTVMCGPEGKEIRASDNSEDLTINIIP